MNITEHKVIVVTGDGIHFQNAYNKALELFTIKSENKIVCSVSKVLNNNYSNEYSFFIAPLNSITSNHLRHISYTEKYNEMILFLSSNDCNEYEHSKNSWFIAKYGDKGATIENCNNFTI